MARLRGGCISLNGQWPVSIKEHFILLWSQLLVQWIKMISETLRIHWWIPHSLFHPSTTRSIQAQRETRSIAYFHRYFARIYLVFMSTFNVFIMKIFQSKILMPFFTFPLSKYVLRVGRLKISTPPPFLCIHCLITRPWPVIPAFLNKVSALFLCFYQEILNLLK